MSGLENKKYSITPIVIALIGLCGTISVAIFGFAQFWLPYQENIKNTQTAISLTLSPSSYLSQPAATVFITLSPLPSLTETPIPPVPTATNKPSPTNTVKPQTIDILADQDRFWHGASTLGACLFNTKNCHFVEQELFLSYCPRDDSGCQNLGFGKVGMHFILSDLPSNVNIENAKLSVYVKSTTKPEFSILLSRADSPWTEETSAEPQCTSDSIRATGISGWNTWDVSSIIRFQHENPSLNYGICLVVDEDVTLIFASSESANPPRVRITYLP